MKAIGLRTSKGLGFVLDWGFLSLTVTGDLYKLVLFLFSVDAAFGLVLSDFVWTLIFPNNHVIENEEDNTNE